MSNTAPAPLLNTVASGFDPDLLPSPWLVLDEQAAVVRHNRAFAHLMGWPADAFQQGTGPAFDQLLTGASRMLFQSYLLPLLRLHGRVQELSLTLMAAAGEAVDVLFFSEPLAALDDAAVPARCLSVSLVPIRRRRDIEARMQRIKRAADASPGLIFQLMQQADGRVQFSYLSEAVRRLYGTTPEAAGQDAEHVLGRLLPDDRAMLREALALAAAAGRDVTTAFRVCGDDGERWHELHATPHHLADGVCLWHGHVADVTERRALQQALADRDTRERLTLLRGDFLARISHELRTPLNGLLGFLQLMGHDDQHPLPPSQAQRLDVAVQAGQHLLQLVNQVLDVSRLDHTEPDAPVTSVLLDSAVRQASMLVLAQAQAQRITLDTARVPPLAVLANELRLRQVLLNLLSNAVKYNRYGGQVKVEAQVDSSGARMALSISDQGPGLSAEQQTALFQPYQRLGANPSAVEGTGLGLVVTRHLLHMMNGKLRVASHADGGSTFTIDLPLAPAARDQRSPGDGSVVPPAATTVQGPAPDGASMPGASPRPTDSPDPAVQTRGTVLCVEDNAVNRLLLEAVLGLRPGLVVHIATCGAEALAAVAQQLRPDLLLLDMQLPDTDGARLLADLRRAGVPPSVPAVLVSADAREDDHAAARSAGFIDCWPKPLDVQRALSGLDRLLAPRA